MDYISANKALKKVKIAALVEKIIGVILTAFNGFLVVLGISQANDSFDVALIFVLGCFTAAGIMLIRSAHQKNNLIKKFSNYSARLTNNPEKSLQDLASDVNEPIETLVKDINKMIAYGFFQNSFIDAKNGRLITPNSNMQNTSFTNQHMHTVSDKPIYITIQCKNCGATNKIVKGSVGECEFCGSQISQ